MFLGFGRPHERKVDWQWIQKQVILVIFDAICRYLLAATEDSRQFTKFEV
jgi:hypothetical protein